ncbi:MAG: histidine phosphatase family protein [Patescibacteria group bacterium]|nr:histidine phosphatase family protein [Patescibacteria group bacterium]
MFKQNGEGINFEGERQVETRVVLEIMRHSIKEKAPEKPDAEIRLSQAGRDLANLKGERLQAQPEVSLAWGSSRKRTHETALRSMLPEHINPYQSLEEIEAMIAQEQKYGKKVIVDDRLNFDLSGPAGVEAMDAFKKGEYLENIFEKSDQRALELGDKTSSTYLRQAGNVAEIIDRYAQVGNNFNRLAARTDKYEKFGNQLERYLATHQGIFECFVAKVLEKKFGVEKRREFQKGLGNGSKETESIRVEIINRGPEQKIIVNYKIGDRQESVELDRNLIEEIIKERQEFDEKFSNKE